MFSSTVKAYWHASSNKTTTLSPPDGHGEDDDLVVQTTEFIEAVPEVFPNLRRLLISLDGNIFVVLCKCMV